MAALLPALAIDRSMALSPYDTPDEISSVRKSSLEFPPAVYLLLGNHEHMACRATQNELSLCGGFAEDR